MKFLQNMFLIITALFVVITANEIQSTSTKKRRKTTSKIKFDDLKIKKPINLGHSYGEQSYPGKTTYPVNTQALPTTWTSRMGNDW